MIDTGFLKYVAVAREYSVKSVGLRRALLKTAGCEKTHHKSVSITFIFNDNMTSLASKVILLFMLFRYKFFSYQEKYDNISC